MNNFSFLRLLCAGFTDEDAGVRCDSDFLLPVAKRKREGLTFYRVAEILVGAGWGAGAIEVEGMEGEQGRFIDALCPVCAAALELLDEPLEGNSEE